MFSKLNYTIVCVLLVIVLLLVLVALTLILPFVLTYEIISTISNFFTKKSKKKYT